MIRNRSMNNKGKDSIFQHRTFRSWEITRLSHVHEKQWLTSEWYHVPAIDPKYPPGNYSRLKRTPSQLSPPLLASPPTPSLPLSPRRNSHRHRRRYRSCFWHRGNTPATYEYLRRLNMHTTDNVLFLLDGRSIYYQARHTYTYRRKQKCTTGARACTGCSSSIVSTANSRFCVKNIEAQSETLIKNRNAWQRLLSFI
jgi:hypothetical protein